MNHSPRIKDLGLTTIDVMQIMSDGNPGALTVMCDIIGKGSSIDPANALGGFGNILNLDTHGIYGARIWQLFKDVCDRNLNRMIGLLRAVQLGYLPERDLHYAIDNNGKGLDIPALLERVKKRLPKFVMPAEEPINVE